MNVPSSVRVAPVTPNTLIEKPLRERGASIMMRFTVCCVFLNAYTNSDETSFVTHFCVLFPKASSGFWVGSGCS